MLKPALPSYTIYSNSLPPVTFYGPPTPELREDLRYRRISGIKLTAHSPFSHGGQRNPSKLSNNVLESIELFKLMKPSMFGREIREMLLNDSVCGGENLPAL